VPPCTNVPPRKVSVYHLLHRLWTKAVDTPGYDKREWQAMERVILRHTVLAEWIVDDLESPR